MQSVSRRRLLYICVFIALSNFLAVCYWQKQNIAYYANGISLYAYTPPAVIQAKNGIKFLHYCNRNYEVVSPAKEFKYTLSLNPPCVDPKSSSDAFWSAYKAAEAVQQANDCRNSDSKYILFFPDAYMCGFGCASTSLIRALDVSMRLNYTLVLAPSERIWAYYSKTTCPTREVSCYFESIVNTTECRWQSLFNATSMKPYENIFETTIDMDRMKFEGLEKMKKHNHFLLSNTWRGLPDIHDDFKASLNRLRYQSALLHYLLRPTADIKSRMFIRRGDSIKDKRKQVPLSDFMRAAEHLRRIHGVTNIYLLTRSMEVWNQTKDYPDWNFYGHTEYMHKDGWHYGESYKAHENDKDVEKDIYGTFVPLFIFRECDMFVGTLLSNFGSIGFKLMVGHKEGIIPPHVSLVEDVRY